MQTLFQDIKYLKGVGPARARILGEELKIFTIRDLLYTFPYKYIDRTTVHTISALQEDMPYVQLKGRLVNIETEGTGRKTRLAATFTDGTGYVNLVWFNSIKHILQSLRVDRQYLLFGKPSTFNGRFSFTHPELSVLRPDGTVEEDNTSNTSLNLYLAGALQPHYHTTEKMKRHYFTSRLISELMHNALQAVAGKLTETLPAYLIAEHGLAPVEESLYTMHFPASAEALPAARRRFKFEELFYLQLDILRYAKNRRLNYAGFTFTQVGNYFHTFYNEHLPFALTGAQKRVIKEIRRDLALGKQMNRLLQGDVGSGKTMVALMVALIALDNGYQACLMAPTEILAEQHCATLRQLTDGMPLSVELLTGNITGSRRTDILRRTAAGEVHILVGTHALIEPKVRFRNLGLAIIDEQHRFGVKQRARLWEKNVRPPHVLVMTATPIPRTLAMTVYGDLDVSVIDELPPGRKPVETLHYTINDTPQLFEGVRHQLAQGRQIYFVYPLIEESEKTDLQDLENGYANICAAFPDTKVGRVHGRMKPAEKEEAMRAFVQGETRILVSTTVIEVGVNVPNATVMVIQNADRFGLSQLHQLRGRVGRGAERSYCLLVTQGKRLSETTRRRIGIMTETTDGFLIAEEDMRLRGPGDMDGTQQSGMPFDLKIANLVRDTDLMATARDTAAALLEQDPEERLPQNAVAWQQLKLFKKSQQSFSEIS